MKNIYIPVEIKARELVGKLLLSCFAAERGHTVYIGHHNEIYRRLDYWPRGIVIEHDATRIKYPKYIHLKKLGHKTLSWDEEGIVELNGNWYVRLRINPETILESEQYLAWGQEQKDWITRVYPDIKNKITTIGNPRIDVLRPEFKAYFNEESKKYKNEHGDYILINSNFANCNIVYKNNEKFIQSKRTSVDLNEKEVDFLRQSLDHTRSLFIAFQKMLPTLAQKFPDRNIIIRPHPAENFDPWQEIARQCANVKVIYEGTASAWSAGSAVLIHNGCTTGLEAAIMGCNVIAFCPVESPEYDLYLPNQVSIKTSTEQELFETIQKTLDTGSTHKDLSFLDYHIASLQGNFASEKTLNLIETIPPQTGINFYKMKKGSYKKIRTMARALALKFITIKNTSTQANQTFPPTSAEEIQDILKKFVISSGRFKNIKLTEIAHHCWKISL